MDPQDKARQRARHLRAAKHWVPLEEQKRRKANKQARGGQPQRARDREVGDDATFEKIRRAERDRPVSPTTTFVPEVGAVDGLVVALTRGRAMVAVEGSTRTARLAPDIALAQQTAIAVGDTAVVVERTDGELDVVAVQERRTWLARPDPHQPGRTRVLAANVDTAVVVVALREPALRPGLIDRFMVTLARGGVRPLVCINKVDLARDDDRDRVRRCLQPHATHGIQTIVTSATAGQGIDELRAALRGLTCVLVGHSGVGKSSLLNALEPGLALRVGSVTGHTGKGRHTTTASSLFELDDGTRMIDTPGIRELGIGALTRDELATAFPDLAELSHGCRFRDCGHDAEPGCAVRAAVDQGQLDASRRAAWLRLRQEE